MTDLVYAVKFGEYEEVLKYLKDGVHPDCLYPKKMYMTYDNVLMCRPYNEHENTALYEACLIGDLKIVQILIEHGADVNYKSSFKHTPLFNACIRGNLEIAKLLLEKGAKINQQNNAWITPLISACSKRRYDVVKFLLDNNADPNIRDENGRTAICYAIQNQDFETTEILLQYGVYLSNKDKQGLYITNLLQYYYFVIDPLKKYVKRKTSIIKEELIEKYWHPDNVKKWSEFYNMDYSDVIEIM